MDIVDQALSAYHASLTSEGFIQTPKKVLGVQVKIDGTRLHFEGAGRLLASGPIAAKTVESFVGKFWYWKKAA